MPKFALIYDFDGTLADECMHDYRLLPDLGIKGKKAAKAFWDAVNEEAKCQKADRVCVGMRCLVKLAGEKNIPLTQKYLRECGEAVQFRKGLTGPNNWFDRIAKICSAKNLEARHYIISSGLAEIIEGCSLADKFKDNQGRSRIFASRFHYNKKEAADWPAWTVNYTTKTQFLFRINKGATDLGDDGKVNEHVDARLREVPFGNMVFIGDGATDIPCFSVLRKEGGFPIAILNSDPPPLKLLQDFVEGGRIEGFSYEQHFESGGKLEQLIARAAERVAAACAPAN